MTAWQVPEASVVGSNALEEEALGSVVWSDFRLETIHAAGEALSVLIERVVSVHILEMRSTTTQESLRALRELRAEFETTPTLRVVPGQLIEAQAVYGYLITPQRPRPIFVSTSRNIEGSPRTAAAALVEFLDPLANQLEGEPEETWRERALAQLGGASAKSPWADAIGLLYSSPGIAAALGVPETEIIKAVDDHLLLALESSDGELLFPAAQVRRDGRIVRGLQWILGQFGDGMIDHYTLAAWLNQTHQGLDDLSVWDVLRESDEFPDTVRDLVAEFRAALSR